MSNTINIPSCTTTHYIQLTNPLVYLLKQAVYKANNDTTSIATALGVLLNTGMMISSNNKFCCPDCVDNKAFYFLGNINDFENIIQALGLDAAATSPKVLPCCVSKNLSAEGMVLYHDLFVSGLINKTPGCCATNFANDLQELYDLSSITSIGNIVEVSSFSNTSGVKIMLDFFKTLDPALTATDYTAIITQILNLPTKSIVIKCVGCDIFIGSSTTFITVGEEIGFITNN